MQLLAQWIDSVRTTGNYNSHVIDVVLQAVLRADVADEAVLKSNLYYGLIADTNSAAWQITAALEGLRKTGDVSDFAYNYYMVKIIGNGDEEARHYFDTISRLRKYGQMNSGSVPKDAFMAMVLSDPERADYYWSRYDRVLDMTRNGQGFIFEPQHTIDFEIYYDLWKTDKKPSFDDYADAAFSVIAEQIFSGDHDLRDFIADMLREVRDVTIGDTELQNFWIGRIRGVQQDRIGREHEIIGMRYSLPREFTRLHPIIQFAAAQYFMQLELGAREGVLRSIQDAGDLSEGELIKLFFTLTGTESVGQFLSLKRGLVPENIRKELEEFQESVEKSGEEVVSATMTAKYGEGWEKTFTRFDYKSGKSGKVGEVYSAELAAKTEYHTMEFIDGEWRDVTHVADKPTPVMLKILTPTREKTLRDMLDRLERVAKLLDQAASRLGLTFNASHMFRELKEKFLAEMNYRQEAIRAYRLAETLPSEVGVPTYITNLSRNNVIVMLPASGVSMPNATLEQKQTASGVLSSVLGLGIFVRGVFHGDPHPGNIFIDGADEENLRLTLIDLGNLGYLSELGQKNILSFLGAASQKDVAEMTRIIAEDLSEKNIGQRDKRGLMQELWIFARESEDIEQEKALEMLDHLFSIAYKHGFYIGKQYADVLVTLIKFEGAMRTQGLKSFSLVPLMINALAAVEQ